MGYVLLSMGAWEYVALEHEGMGVCGVGGGRYVGMWCWVLKSVQNMMATLNTSQVIISSHHSVVIS